MQTTRAHLSGHASRISASRASLAMIEAADAQGWFAADDESDTGPVKGQLSLRDLLDAFVGEADAGLEPVIGLADRDHAAAEAPDREGGVARVGR